MSDVLDQPLRKIPLFLALERPEDVCTLQHLLIVNGLERKFGLSDTRLFRLVPHQLVQVGLV